MVRSGAHLAIFNESEDKILLTQRRDNQLWVMPGGHLEENEGFEEAVVREVEEEIGYKVKVGKLVLILSIPNSNQEKRVYKGEIVGGEQRLSDEVKKVAWFDFNKLPLMTIYEKERIETVLSNPEKTVKRDYVVNNLKEIVNLIKSPIILFNAIATELKRS